MNKWIKTASLVLALSLLSCEGGGLDANSVGNLDDTNSTAEIQLLPYLTLDKILTFTLKLDPNMNNGAVDTFRDNNILFGAPNDQGVVNTSVSSTYFINWQKIAFLACDEVDKDLVFPDGDPRNIDTLYRLLIGRSPTDEEIAIHEELQDSRSYQSTEMRMVASCASCLGSTAFLTQ